MSTTATSTAGGHVELTEAERAVIAWHAESEAGNHGETIGGPELDGLEIVAKVLKPNGESGVTCADEREEFLADHLGKLAACEGLLARLPVNESPLTGEHVMGQIGELLSDLLHRVPADDPYRGSLEALYCAANFGNRA